MTEPQHDSDLSRRSLVKTAATAAAVGGALAIAGPASAATAAAPAAGTGQVPATRAPHQSATGDVVVHVRNAAAGELDVYTPTGHRDVTDPALAARLLHLAR